MLPAKTFLSLLVSYMLVPIRLGIGLCLALFLAVSGPFGTYNAMSLPERLAYWFIIVFLSILVVNAGRALIATILPEIGEWTSGLLSSLFAALCLPPLVMLVTLGLFAVETLEMPPYPGLVGVVFGVTMFIFAIRAYVSGRKPSDSPRLFQRLADRQAKAILRVTVRDHYVDVYTDRGKETLLMRFSDALAELDGLNGYRVHRSHWVAAEAVRGYRKQGSRAFVVLSDGSEVPVSRGYREEIEAELSKSRRARERPVPMVRS